MTAVRELVAWVSGALFIAKRELLALFVTPLAYLVATLFLLNQGWNFSLLLRALNDPLAAPGPVMQFFFGGSFFIFWLPVIFICSALSMRQIAEERRAGTLEALLTAPVHASQLVVGKFAGSVVFYVALWLPTGVLYVLLRGASTLGPGAAPEAGPVLAGYLGTFLVGATFMGFGLLTSSLARTQLAAAVGTTVTCTIVLLAGLLVDQLEAGRLTRVLEWTSLLTMMQEMSQGIVDIKWLFVHLGAVAVALTWAATAVDPRRDLQSLIRAASVTVIVVSLSIFAGRRTSRQDWTSGQVFSLSERAKVVLEDLRGPIDVTVMIPATIGGGRVNPVLGEVREVLFRMAKESAALRPRVIDPDRQRQQAEQLLIDHGLRGRDLADGVILIRAGQGAQLRRAHVFPRDLVTYATGPEVQVNGPRVESFRGEEALLTRFLEVSEARRLRVCMTQGHGEPALDNLEPYAGYAHLRDLLREANLETTTVDLGEAEALTGCDVLFVGGPQGGLPRPDVRAIERYVDEGGDVLLMAGAVVRRGRSGISTHGLEPLAARFGVHFGDRVVLDPHQMAGGSPLLAFTIDGMWGDHPVGNSLVHRPISLIQVRELWLDGDAEPVLSVTDGGWAESDVDGFQLGRLQQFDIDVDRAGPIPVVAAGTTGGARLLVIASDQFALNAFMREDVLYDHGRDLILNAIGWLSERDVLLGIRARPREHVKLVLQPDQLQRMNILSILGLPGFAILLGFLVLWSRRR